MTADKGIFTARSVHAFKAVDMEHLCRNFCLCFCDLLYRNETVKSLPMVLRSLPWHLPNHCNPWTSVSWEMSFLASMVMVNFLWNT